MSYCQFRDSTSSVSHVQALGCAATFPQAVTTGASMPKAVRMMSGKYSQLEGVKASAVYILSQKKQAVSEHAEFREQAM
jgi:outer membrane lipoprotein-sorting protein